MDYDRFIGHVQDRAQLPDRQSAVRATRATLETLGERLLGEQATNLAAELPQEIGAYLRQPSPEAERFDSEAFLTRVAEKESAPQAEATYHARVVAEVLRESLSAGSFEKLRKSLPDDYARVLDSGSAGQMPSP